ncbi:MAG TPA: hypothetical protein VG604_00420 [Candidatus Saccharimonadales bacterium]|nr:hypothetical protein [Candidatus Saccharimonadales bacterium]
MLKDLGKAQPLQIAAWVLSLIVSGLAIFVWGHDNGWQIWHFNAYQFFPVLGLLAWSLMWTHYVMGTLRELMGLPKEVLVRWFNYTGWVVLVAICLHPGLLIYQRFQDGFGLPPHSYESFVAPGLGWITLLGSASLLVFLAFEFHRFYADRSWWHYVNDLCDLAMVAIFYHALRLGSQLMVDTWFKAVWWFYGLSLLAVLARKYYLKLRPKTT